jgi:hypothetical protein
MRSKFYIYGAMTSPTPTELGWDSHFQQQLIDDDLSVVVPVRVMNVQRSGLYITGGGMDQHLELSANDHELGATVGDWLLIDKNDQRIIRRLVRKSLFKRRAPGTDRKEQLIAANVDTLFIVSSCNQDFNEARLERYLATAREAEVMAVIVLTKADLADDPQQGRKTCAGNPGGSRQRIAKRRSSMSGAMAWQGTNRGATRFVRRRQVNADEHTAWR